MITLQLISDEDDLCRMILSEEELATMLLYVKDTADGVRDAEPDNVLNLAVQSTAVGLVKFLADPWSYSNQPKCITCNRALSAEEWDDTGQCPFCNIDDLEVVTLADEQDTDDDSDTPGLLSEWPTTEA